MSSSDAQPSALNPQPLTLLPIPKIIHQVWLGPKRPPEKWMSTWKVKNPDWEYRLWTEKNLPKLINQPQFDKIKTYYGKADIARMELLYQYGGIYIDCDIECINPLDDELRQDPFFACYENEEVRQKMICNAVFGSAPKHSLLKDMIDALGKIEDVNRLPAWVIVGPYLFTLIVELYNLFHGNVPILPSFKFFPMHFNGVKYQGKEKVYSTHHWQTTAKTDVETSKFKYEG